MEKEKGFLSSLWDSLSSVRLTIPLLIILAIASIFGTLIPQNASPEEYLRVYKVSTYKILKILGFLDMFHAGWFVFLLVLLCLNLVACSLKRLRTTMRFFYPEPRMEEDQGKTLPGIRRFSQKAALAETLPRVQEVLSQFLGRPKVLEGPLAYHLFAEKGNFSRLGVYFVHLSILIILAGALIGSIFGFRGYVNIVEGEMADRVVLRGGQLYQPLGFGVKLEKFDVSFYPTGAPKEFRSTVTILEGDQKILTEPIRVNHPLTYKGVSLYQSSYGIASVEKAILEVQERRSAKGFTLLAQMGVQVKIPESSSAFILNRFLPDLQGMGPAFQVLLWESNRRKNSFWLLQNHPEFTQNQPEQYQFRIKEIVPRYYSGLQATKDPGVWVVWIGCILMMAGFYLAFFMSHRRVWVRLTEKEGGTIVEIGGSSHRGRSEFEEELERMAETLKGNPTESLKESEERKKSS